MDNIAAIATANGYAGIGIIRISGKHALSITKKIIGTDRVITPRQASYCDFLNQNGEIIDSGLVIYFKAPHSFTGEDVVELHGHGSPVALNMLLQECLGLGCRLADAGEFSRRAFLNNKIDLIQAESIIDLIQAESEAGVKSALKSLKGQFSEHIQAINQQLIDLRMFVEATLDFPEEDIEFIANAKIHAKLKSLQQEIHLLLNSTKQGVLLNNGANIVIVGRPNVGKSSLLNALANEDIAIVTTIAGTTRDIVKEKIIINGIAFNIIDTAGIRDTQDIVEQIGIERALAATQNAEICLVLMDDSIGITADDKKILNQLPANIKQIFVHNKIDLTQKTEKVESHAEIHHVFISAKHKLGINLLRNTILDLIGFDSNNHDIFIARTRHLNNMRRAIGYIDTAFNNWNNLEILAEELRYAHNELTQITGEFSSDDLLGEIFSKFCIGK